MWPSGRDLMPYLAAFPVPQNSTIYNLGGNSEIQNQQDGITWPSSAPWSEQALTASFSQQESGVRLPQDRMTADIVLGNQNWLFHNRYRRENMWPEFKNGEVVMVRCNQHKWLHGTIRRMTAQGVRIWIADADILVNVPLVLVPTHVLKMSTYSELRVLPPPEPLWTMAITDSTGCRKSLVQCVRPAHLSHRQLFYKLGCIECAICKMTVSSMDVVGPWNCSHRVHNYCLQLRMQHSSTSACPSCNEIGTSQRMPLPSTGNDSTLQGMPSSPTDRDLTLQIVPSTFTGLGSTSELMPSSSTGDVFTNLSNGQHRQWFDIQCACGFRGSINGINNKNAPVFCPNCHQSAYINPMTIGTQSGEQLASMNLPPDYRISVDRESLQRSIRDRRLGWPMQYLGDPRRLDAIEEGSREGICSTPTSPAREEPSYFPSYLLAFGETFENNMSDPDVAVSSVDQNMLPSPSSRSFVQDGVLTASSPTRVTPVQNGLSSARSSLQDSVSTALSPIRVTLIQNEQSNARSSSQDGTLPAPSSTQVNLVQVNDNASASPTEHLIGPAESTHVNHVKFSEVEEADKSSKKLEPQSPTIASPERHRLWRRVSEVDWFRKTHDEDSENSEKGSSSIDFASHSPPVYVNHFADFVKLAMANASTAEDILAGASLSPSSSTAHLPPLKSPTPAFMTPVDLAFGTPAPAFFTRPPLLITEAPAAMSPAPAFFTRPAPLLTDAPAAVSPASAFFTRPSALITEAGTVSSPVRTFYSRPPVLITEPQPALLTEAPATVSPVRTFFSRAPGMITQPPAWVTAAKDPNGGDGSAAWITVIKDGVDSRKDDVKQWEMDRLVREKESKFS